MGEPVILAGAAGVAEGELTSLDVDGREIAVCRVEGVVYAFDDECTHRACSLAEGELEGTVVLCPCHAGEFDVTTGEVVSGPPPDPVAVYPVRASGDDLVIEV